MDGKRYVMDDKRPADATAKLHEILNVGATLRYYYDTGNEKIWPMRTYFQELLIDFVKMITEFENG